MASKLAMLALTTGLLLASKKANADDNSTFPYFDLFPHEPLYRLTMVDSDLPRTEITFKEESLQNLSLGGTLPLFSTGIASKNLAIILKKDRAKDEPRAEKKDRTLSERVINATLMVSGLVKFPVNQQIREELDYKMMAELFIGSPMMDDHLSDGNKIYLVGGWVGKGSIKLDKDLDSISNSLIDNPIKQHSFFADAYAVIKSPWSDQFLVGRFGIDNLLGNTTEKPNVYFSGTMEFPSLLSWAEMFENFKISPYISLYMNIPTNNPYNPKFLGEVGAKLSGEAPGKAVSGYARIIYEPRGEQVILYGAKLSL